MRRGSSINNAIWCVNALLALGILGFSFKYIFLAKPEDPWPENPTAPSQETGHVDKGLDEFKSIWESQLVPPAQAPGPKAETWPPIKYDGKFGSQFLFKVNGQDGQGKPGAAIEVSDGQGGWQPVTVNGKKVLVKEIQKEKIILELEGSPAETKEIPLLDQEGSGAAPPNPGPGGGPPPKAPDISFGTREVSEKTWKVDPKERDFLRTNAQELAKDVRWSLYGVENGKAKGVRIEGFTEGSYAEQLAKARGIVSGDIIKTINGRTIDGAEAVNELFGDGEAWTKGKAQVEVERAGKVQTLSYAVQ